MPVLRLIRERFAEEKPLNGVRLVACAHITTETANLARALQAAGAECCADRFQSSFHAGRRRGCARFRMGNFQSTRSKASRQTRTTATYRTLDTHPDIIIDDGSDVVATLRKNVPISEELIGSTEETTTGIQRLKAMEIAGVLSFPSIAVNNAQTKHFFDNRYGTGQSTLDGIIRATNILLAGRNLVVVGYGWCGKGVALRGRGMGANIIVTEVDPIKAVEAVMDGFR